jgi:hypothetical protein
MPRIEQPGTKLRGGSLILTSGGFPQLKGWKIPAMKNSRQWISF